MGRVLKESGIQWIGEIPTSWELQKIGTLYTERREKVSDRDFAPLSVTMKGIVQQLSTAAKTDAHDDRKLVKQGDFAINSRSDRRGSCGIAPCDGSISLINTVLKPRRNMNPSFYDWVFHSTMFSDEFYKWGHGIVDDLWTTNWSDMKKITIPVPPLDEQQRIADFLNKQCNTLDSAVNIIQASISEYKQLKHIVITKAVTQGVRGIRSMRDSGLVWAGMVPTDWTITSLKFCATLKAGITLGKTYPKDTELVEVPYLRVANVQGDHVDLSDVATIQVTAEEIEKYALHDGELLMTEGGDRDKLGRGTIWHGEIAPCIHQNHVFAVETDESKLLVRFFDYVTSAAPARTYFDLTAKKTTNLACTNSTTILRYRFALPPIAEQQEIVEYLDSKCVELDALIAKKEQYLVELENYKKSLIYEYVTGKKEVR